MCTASKFRSPPRGLSSGSAGSRPDQTAAVTVYSPGITESDPSFGGGIRPARPPPERATIGRVTLLFTLLTLVVLGVTAAVATGKIVGGLEEPSTSLAARGLPEGSVMPESLEAVRFSPAVRGYRMEEVDAVLDRLGAELARRDREILRLGQELRLAERAYLRRAARSAASSERAVPGADGVPDWSTDSVEDRTPSGGGHAGQGDPEHGPPAPSGVGFDRPGYGDEGREHPAQQVGDSRADEPDRREG
jgi:DivIVA domain-containing protein